ncbi:MAG TPA: lactate racemase domain-containing protein [Pyrinomonadaceae bacterium]|jgi:nickel-dependent lactate racemase|nr:lactate racemase domain-containing protein [Pyrinomonadaceae bacterium]
MVSDIIHEALNVIEPGERVLAIIPDKTRDDNTDLLFPIANQYLIERGVACFDALVAQGTHPPMTDAQKRLKIGLPEFAGRIFDHCWDRADEIVTLGELSVETVSALTGGLIDHAVPVTINKLLGPGVYDTVLVIGATVPHEVAGFAGGAKYFFPGVAGPELTHTTHWLGALAGIENTIGQVETPTRKLIEAAVELVPARIISLNSVVSRGDDGKLITYALFTGDIKDAFRRAAAVSREVHIRYTGRKYKRVIALLDPHYDELWVGGKASYKLGAVIEDGGELIIFAPHLNKLSATHGALIEKYGYAPLESVRDMLGVSQELRENLCIAAHLAHVAYAGRTDADGNIVPRYRITMASGIDEQTCKRVNLGYLDYRTFDYRITDPDTLIVNDAGRDLYKISF